MKLTSDGLKIVTDELQTKIKTNHVGNITVINSHDVFLSFSLYRKEKLLISLNPRNPLICLIKVDNPIGTKVGKLNDLLRKEIRDGFILNISQKENDRVVIFEYTKTNDYYEKEHRKMIVELIPHRPNLIILKDDDTIIFAVHYTDALSKHPIVKGMKYQPLENETTRKESEFDEIVYKEECEKYYQTALRTRFDEQFKPVSNHIKSRIKSLKRKIDILNNEIKTATKNLEFQEIGQMILTYAYDESSLKEYIKDKGCEYDSSLTPGVNAEKYFTKYKKAKRTIEIGKQELIKTSDEIDYLENCLVQSKFMDEDDMEELANLLFPHKYKVDPKKKKQAKYGEVTYKDTKIYFGKNAKQNDELTFKKANKNYWFFHVKDLHGSHVIVASDNPDNDIKLVACEIALLLSGKDCGEVQSTMVKNIKKGSSLGQALLTSYETFVIKSVREETLELLNL